MPGLSVKLRPYLEGVTKDETPRASTLEKMATLEPLPGFPRLTEMITAVIQAIFDDWT